MSNRTWWAVGGMVHTALVSLRETAELLDDVYGAGLTDLIEPETEVVVAYDRVGTRIAVWCDGSPSPILAPKKDARIGCRVKAMFV
jgi:hypothetical protein